jgi:hypothetical protein
MAIESKTFVRSTAVLCFVLQATLENMPDLAPAIAFNIVEPFYNDSFALSCIVVQHLM